MSRAVCDAWLAGVRMRRSSWQLASELKNRVYALIEADPRIQRDVRFRDHFEGAASSAPRLIAEGFGRYLPGDFSGYLRKANGELKEKLECLQDGVDRGYFTTEQIVPLQRLCVPQRQRPD